MGIGCSCFGVSSKRPPDLNDHMNIIEIKKRQFQFHEQDDDKKKFITLRDRLLASPPVNGYYTSINGDHEMLQSHFYKQNKVYPSLGEREDCPDYGYNNPRGSFSKKRLLKIDEVDICNEIVPSLRKSRSKKTKKRVSFRLPEEADIFIYNLTEEDE